MDIEKALAQAKDLGARCRGDITFYSLLFIIVDGSLQAEEQKVDVRCSSGRIRVYMRSAVPANRLEFDARESVATGRKHQVIVLGPGGEFVVKADMKVLHFAISHSVEKPACARYIFECNHSDAQWRRMASLRASTTKAKQGERDGPDPMTPEVLDLTDVAVRRASKGERLNGRRFDRDYAAAGGVWLVKNPPGPNRRARRTHMVTARQSVPSRSRRELLLDRIDGRID